MYRSARVGRERRARQRLRQTLRASTAEAPARERGGDSRVAGPGTNTQRLFAQTRELFARDASLSNPRAYALNVTPARAPAPPPPPRWHGLEQKSPMSTNIAGAASRESNPSNTARKRRNVAARSSHTSDMTTNMSSVLVASDFNKRAMSVGRSRPAPKKSLCAAASADSSRDSAGGNPNARASKTPSATRTSPSATTMQFSVNSPEDVAAFERSIWIVPVRSSRKNRSSSSCDRHPITYLVSPAAPSKPVSGVSSQYARVGSFAARDPPHSNEGFVNILCLAIRC